MTPDELVAFAEDLARIAASGGGAKALAGRLASGAQVGVLVEDAEWRHIAAAGAVDVPSVRALLDAAPAPRAYQRLRNGFAGRTIALAAGDTRLGQLTVFGDRDLDALEHAARLTASAIAMTLAAEAGAQPGRKRAFWERLAGGAYQDAVAVRDDAAARGIKIATHYVAIALEAEPGHTVSDTSAVRALSSDAFRGSEADLGVLERAGSLLFFVPAEREVDAANARTAATLLPRTVAKTHPHVRISGGVGSRAGLLSLADSIAEAEAALTIARRLRGSGQVAAYEDLGAYPLLLRGADPAAMREFARRILAPLRSYDEKHQTELERTLRLYFAVGENVKTAAAELCVHRHTVFYRLRQIGEICTCRLDDPHDQLTLRIALAIDALTA